MCVEIVIRIYQNFVESYADNWWIDYCCVVWLICKFPGLNVSFALFEACIYECWIDIADVLDLLMEVNIVQLWG